MSLKETQDYRVEIYPATSARPGGHYGVINKTTAILEFESAIFPEACQYLMTAQKYWETNMLGEKQVKILT